jgi:hypothetical protein
MFFINIDWEDVRSGAISVDRNEFHWSAEAEEAIKAVLSRGKELQAQTLSVEPSIYQSLNAMINNLIPLPEKPWWRCMSKGKAGWGKAEWAPISFPALLDISCLKFFDDIKEIRWQGQNVSIVLPIMRDLPTFPGMRVAVVQDEPLVITSLATSSSRAHSRRHTKKVNLAEFPPSWRNLCGASVGSPKGSYAEYELWNSEHPLVQKISETDIVDFLDHHHYWEDPAALNSQSSAALALITFLRHRSTGEAPLLIGELWDLIFPDKKVRADLGYWVQYLGNWGKLFIMSPAGAVESVAPYEQRFRDFLPNPGREWRLDFRRTKGRQKPERS